MSFESTSLDINSERKIERLLIVRLSAMGDVIHTLPAVHALREAFPQAFIGWLIEERWAELLCAPGSLRRGRRSRLRPLVDEVHTVNLKAWGESLFSILTLQRAVTVWNDVRDTHYDVAVDLQGGGAPGALRALGCGRGKLGQQVNRALRHSPLLERPEGRRRVGCGRPGTASV